MRNRLTLANAQLLDSCVIEARCSATVQAAWRKLRSAEQVRQALASTPDRPHAQR